MERQKRRSNSEEKDECEHLSLTKAGPSLASWPCRPPPAAPSCPDSWVSRPRAGLGLWEGAAAGSFYTTLTSIFLIFVLNIDLQGERRVAVNRKIYNA